MRPRTLKDILRIVGDLVAFSGTSELEHMQTPAIRSFLHHGRLEKGWSPKTFHIYRQYLKTFFDWCRRQGFLRKNPVDSIEKPKLPSKLPRALPRDQARKILFSATWYPWRYGFQKARNTTILAIFLLTGIRLQELLNLNISDVDLPNRQILIQQGKGRKDRWVPINDRLFHFLKQYFDARKTFGKKSDCLFPGLGSQKRLRVKDIRRICQVVGRDANVKFTPHMLRHTFARAMVENDFPLYKLKEIMGHSSILTTQIYLSVSRSNLQKSFALVNLY